MSSRDVIFDEMRHHDSIAEPSKGTTIEMVANIDDDTDSSDSCDDKDGSVSSHRQESDSPDPVPADEAPADLRNREDTDSQAELTHYPTRTRSGRVSKPPQKYFDVSGTALSVRCGNEDATTPTTYNEAIRGPDKAAWPDAMQEEIDQLHENNTWVLEPLPHKAKPVQNKWVYVTKKDAQQRVTRHRACLVAKGFTQKLGVDYNESFAPVAKYSTLRFLLAVVQCAWQAANTVQRSNKKKKKATETTTDDGTRYGAFETPSPFMWACGPR